MSFDKKRKLKLPKIRFDETCASGTVVRSRSGRSRGRVYAVADTKRDAKGKLFAYIVNGDEKSLSNAKLKSAVHLEVLGKDEKWSDDEGVRQVLNKYR